MALDPPDFGRDTQALLLRPVATRRDSAIVRVEPIADFELLLDRLWPEA